MRIQLNANGAFCKHFHTCRGEKREWTVAHSEWRENAVYKPSLVVWILCPVMPGLGQKGKLWRGGAICKQFKSVPVKKNVSSYFPHWPHISQEWPGDFHARDRSPGSSLYPQTLFLNSFEQALKAITHTKAEVLRGQLHTTVNCFKSFIWCSGWVYAIMKAQSTFIT